MVSTEQKHTKEPWVAKDTGVVAISGGANVICEAPIHYLESHQRWSANSARIVACVNACAGMPDPAAEFARLRDEVAKLKAELFGAMDLLATEINVPLQECVGGAFATMREAIDGAKE